MVCSKCQGRGYYISICESCNGKGCIDSGNGAIGTCMRCGGFGKSTKMCEYCAQYPSK